MGTQAFRCAVGRGGVRSEKREGDGATPQGRFPLLYMMYRPDRLSGIQTGLALRKLQPQDGWCDDPADPHYNTLIEKPFFARHESLWREDRVYDAIVVVGYNMTPVVLGKGSAIFLHVAQPNFSPTDGCVALALADLLNVAAQCRPGSEIELAP